MNCKLRRGRCDRSVSLTTFTYQIGVMQAPAMTSVERDETIAFIVTTHSRTEKYIPLVRTLVDTFWPEHPPLAFLTDGISQPSADVISIPGLTWLDLLAAGLARIKQQRPQTKHVFHMLEDHCPLRRCDGERLDRIFAIARRNNLDAVSFPTYYWPWNETESTIYPDGLVRTWRRTETLQLDDELLAMVPLDFFRYFQVQPTLWRFDYLEAACANAKPQGIADAWTFEAMRWPNAGRHYVSATIGLRFITAFSRKEGSIRQRSSIWTGSARQVRIASLFGRPSASKVRYCSIRSRCFRAPKA